jgi:hypothetical protein
MWSLRRTHVVWHGHGGRMKTNTDAETDQMMIAGPF